MVVDVNGSSPQPHGNLHERIGFLRRPQPLFKGRHADSRAGIRKPKERSKLRHAHKTRRAVLASSGHARDDPAPILACHGAPLSGGMRKSSTRETPALSLNFIFTPGCASGTAGASGECAPAVRLCRRGSVQLVSGDLTLRRLPGTSENDDLRLDLSPPISFTSSIACKLMKSSRVQRMAKTWRSA
eukprot:4990794-Prymnesium_polylepis.2